MCQACVGNERRGGETREKITRPLTRRRTDVLYSGPREASSEHTPSGIRRSNNCIWEETVAATGLKGSSTRSPETQRTTSATAQTPAAECAKSEETPG